MGGWPEHWIAARYGSAFGALLSVEQQQLGVVGVVVVVVSWWGVWRWT
jgi:hypothetical protein